MSTLLIGANGLVFRVRTVNWALLLGAAASFGWQPMDMVFPLCADIDSEDSADEAESKETDHSVDETDPKYERIALEVALVRILEVLRMDTTQREAAVAVGIDTSCGHCRADVHSERMAAIEALNAAHGEVLIESFLAMLMDGEVAIRQ